MNIFYKIFKRLGYKFLHILNIISDEQYKAKKSKYCFCLFGDTKKSKLYWNEIKPNNKNVVYTCITGNYDKIVLHEYLNPEYDYICFTDNEKLLKKEVIGAWKIRPLFNDVGDNQKNNRWHKLFPNLCLSEYENSIYVDGNINFLTAYIFDLVDKVDDNDFISIGVHYKRSCVYKEAEKCLQINKDKPDIIKKQIDLYEKEGMPKNFGLAENGVIFRRHNNADCVNLMSQWWDMLQNYSKRDQLSLFYLIWKNNIDFHYLTNKPIRKDRLNFRFNYHC